MNKVTIMIPTYNQSQYIEQAVNSALAQDYQNIEIVISDDSTDDLTENIVKKKYKKYLESGKIKYFHNKPSLGRVKNYRTTLYERTMGDYVLNLDGDDWLIDNNYISEAVKILDENKDVVCVIAGQKMYIEDENKFISSNKNNCNLLNYLTGIEYLCNLLEDNCISFNHLTSLYRRSWALKKGFYKKNIIFTDAESVFRSVLDYKVVYYNKDVGVWRRHSRNETFGISKIKNFDKLFEDFMDIANDCEKCKRELEKCSFFDKMKFHHLKMYMYEIKRIRGNKEFFIMLSKLFLYDRKLFFRFLKWVIQKVKSA
jgi:glycosyltransferase involved in cell wall biosynthesis